MKKPERWTEETESAKTANHLALMQLFERADKDRRATVDALEVLCSMHGETSDLGYAIRALEQISLRALELAEKVAGTRA